MKINEEPIKWKEAINMKKRYGGWNSLAIAKPSFAFDVYKDLRIADLGRALIRAYSNSKDEQFINKIKNIGSDLSYLPNSYGILFGIGRNTSSQEITNNAWENGIRALEDAV